MQYIRNYIPPDKFIVSDPLTSWMIQAATPNPVLDTRQLPIGSSRTASCAILSPERNMPYTLQLMKGYKVEYVVVNTTFTKEIMFDYFGVDVGELDGTIFVHKFMRRPDIFERLYNEQGIYIFRFSGK